MITVDKGLLFKPRLPEDTVDIPGVGTVRVRGLSRLDSLEVEKVRGDSAAFEARMISLGIVDPELTEEEVGQWQAAAGSEELNAVVGKIAELSGLLASSEKDAMREFEANPDAEFPVLSRAEAGNDGVPAGSGDVQR